MDENRGEYVNETPVFVEKNELLNCLKVVCSKSYDVKKFELERYQEKATLLDSSLTECISPIMVKVEEILQEHEDICMKETGVVSLCNIKKYENEHLTVLLNILYEFMKVRGYKTIVKFLPHEVSDLEPVLRLFLSIDENAVQLWKSRYCLFVWLSILVIIPFDLKTVDSTLGNDENTNNEGKLIPTIIETCKTYLLKHEASREVAGICLSKLLTRPDLEESHLLSFIDWSTSMLEKIMNSETINTATQVIGILQCLCSIFQCGDRNTLLKISKSALHIIQLVNKNSSGEFQLRNKLIMKLCQRIGMSFLPPRVPKWIYNRGRREIHNTINIPKPPTLDNNNTLPNTIVINKEEREKEEVEEDYSIPEDMDGVVDTLLCGLRDSDTDVRWSSAKGIGRITCRLPTLELADQILEGVIDVFSDNENENAWHGGCLALAELARRGLLLPVRLKDVVPIVMKALSYDVRRGNYSVGTNVRDAASYVCWAFARAYTPDVLKDYQLEIAKNLMVTALYDREINCRRAASAAFQENVGRQGHSNFSHGIDILTKTDFYAVGNRNNSYLILGPYVASFSEYSQALIDHVVNVKIEHWDAEIRTLSAEALHNLTPCNPDYMVNTVIPRLIQNTLSSQVYRRHGALLALSEIILSLYELNYELKEDVLKSIRNVVINVEKERLYRGKGGSIVRVGICRLIECISLCHHPLSEKGILRLLQSLDEHFKQSLEDIQKAASYSFRSFSEEYFKQLSCEMMDKVISVYVLGLQNDDNPAVTRGFSLALGCLPSYCINTVERQKVVFNALINATHIQEKRDERDAETRRNAMKALSDLACRVGMNEEGLNEEIRLLVFDSLYNGTMDYCIEDRGDVGSWIRKESLLGMEKFMNMLLEVELEKPNLLPLNQYNKEIKIGSILHTKYGKGKLIEKENVKTEKGENEELLIIEFDEESIGSRIFPLKKGKINKNLCQMEIIGRRGEEGEEEEEEFNCGDIENRKEYLTENINQKVLDSLSNQIPLIKNEYKRKKHYYNEDMIIRLMNVLIKQCVEKIDNIRQTSGEILLRILYHNPPFLYIPNKSELEKLIPKDFNSWSSPQFVYPMMVKVLSIDGYNNSLVEGIVVSVGGLTESLSKPSSDALIQWCNKQSGMGLVWLNHFAFYIIHVFELYKGNVRIIYPLFQMCEKLLNNNCFNKLNEKEHERFNLELIRVSIDEVKRTRDAKKILYSIPIFINLLSYEGGEVRKQCIKHLLVNLTHTFPKVRNVTAEQLYIKFLTLENFLDEDNMDKVLDILSTTNWNEDVEELKKIKLPLYEIFKLPPPQYYSKPSDGSETSKKGTSKKDDKDKDGFAQGFQEMLDLGLDAAASSEFGPSLLLYFWFVSVLLYSVFQSSLVETLNIGIFSLIPLLRSIRRNLSSVSDIRNEAVEMYNLSFNEIKDEKEEIKNRLSNIGKMSIRKYLGWIFQLPQIVYPNIEYIGKDVIYSKINNTSLKLDIIISKKYKNSKKQLPIFYFIHGGGWFMGSRKISSIPLLYELANNGWLIVTVSYRFCLNVSYPENLKDCKRGLQWVKENIYKYNGNKDFIIVGGESAGSHLSLLLSLTSKDKELNEGIIDDDINIKGCVDLYGVHDITNSYNYLSSDLLLSKAFKYEFGEDESKYKFASPYQLLESNKPFNPILIIHGNCDEIIPYSESCRFYDLVESKNIENSYLLTIPFGKHCFNYFLSPRCYACDEVIGLYLDLLLMKYNK